MIQSLGIDLQPFDKTLFLNEIGQRILDKIKENIRLGINNDGDNFASYSKSYASFSGKNKVDFDMTGRLLSQLAWKIEQGKLYIFADGDRKEVAEDLNKRKNWSFLDWGKLLDEELSKAIQEHIDNKIKEEL